MTASCEWRPWTQIAPLSSARFAAMKSSLQMCRSPSTKTVSQRSKPSLPGRRSVAGAGETQIGHDLRPYLQATVTKHHKPGAQTTRRLLRMVLVGGDQDRGAGRFSVL